MAKILYIIAGIGIYIALVDLIKLIITIYKKLKK